MNEKFDPDSEGFRPPNGRDPHPHSHDSANGHSSGKFGVNGHSREGLNFWTFADLLLQRWHWPVIGAILGIAAFLYLGWRFIGDKYTATAELMRYEAPGTSEFLKTTPLSSETFVGLLGSPDLMRRVGAQVQPPIPPEKLRKQIKVDPAPESDLVKVIVAGRTPAQAVNLANLFVNEAVLYTKEIQAHQAADLAQNYLKQQVEKMDGDISALYEQFRNVSAPSQVTNKLAQIGGDINALHQHLAASPRPSLLISKLSERLQQAVAELSQLTAKYTDLHPAVQQQRAVIQGLKNEISGSSTNSAIDSAFGGMGVDLQAIQPELEIIRGNLRSLEDARVELARREQETQLFAAKPPGICRAHSLATLKSAESNKRWLKIALVTVFGGLFGIGCSLGLFGLVELTDNRLKTADDVKRVTRLPVLTTLGNLHEMPHDGRVQWAFRTWTILQGRLSRSHHHGLVCGFTSSTEGEGRSTWIRLLAEAASLSGFRVLTIATKPSPTHMEHTSELLEGGNDNPADEMNAPSEEPETASEYSGNEPGDQHPGALSQNVLSSPARVTEQLIGPNSQPVVHIPLPGWVWNLERRKEWFNAIQQWRAIENLVIFVELPPASVPESVLLGSNLPNLLWLTASGRAEAGETRTQLETLRHARCKLVGAVLNHEPAKPIKRRFARWVTAFTLLSALCLSTADAQTLPGANTKPIIQTAAANPEATPPAVQPEPPAAENAPPANVAQAAQEVFTNVSFSVVSPAQRAAWQQRLTLGPGDILTFSLYGEPTLTQLEVFIPPDGRVSYLQATGILATGLTVDELRAKVDEQLGKFWRSPRVIITPVSFRSKKYFVLGKVAQRGVYVLDRPITIIEAIARAHGIESGQLDSDTVDLADFQRSFLMRNGKRIPVNFEKLFQEGDLTQNVPIEPNDYLYFPSANINGVYVLGEVALPGIVTYRPDSTVTTVISARGGFSLRAYKSRVLVVRGSLNHPETFAVDVLGTVTGKKTDFKLQPKDIVFVSHRPFILAEDLLDLATTAFIQSVISTWAGIEVVSPTGN